jgi:gliding motility-associated-like protein
MIIEPSISNDGNYNINCANGKTGTIDITPVNSVGAVEYRWSDGIIGDMRRNLSDGTYRVIITDANNCHADSSVTLTEPERIRLALDVTNAYCPDKPDGEIRLNVTGGVIINDYTYLWSDNSVEKDLIGVLPGLYTVSVTDFNGCSRTGSAQVEPTHEMCLIIPEAFSPNGDLINDTWVIDNIELYPDVVIKVFNRWGQHVWTSLPGYTSPWDGRSSNGVSQPIDSYHYTVDLHNGFRIIIGSITIVR